MKKPLLITITGPESTGKSTLAEQLGAHFRASVVADVSRAYIAALQRPYTAEDVLKIAEQIIAAEDSALASEAEMVFTDNDLINIKIWLRYYGWDVPDWLQQQIARRKSELYLLCNIDLPWVLDPQRNNEHDRLHLYNSFKQELESMRVNYKVIDGTSQARLQSAVTAIRAHLEI